MVALIVAFSLQIFAQTQGQAEQPMPLGTEKTEKQRGQGKVGAGHHKQMMADLGITQEQGQKLRTINETMKGKMQAIRTDNSLTKEQKRAQVQALNEAHDAEVKTILTPEQFAKWSAARQERLAERKDKRGGGQKN